MKRECVHLLFWLALGGGLDSPIHPLTHSTTHFYLSTDIHTHIDRERDSTGGKDSGPRHLTYLT